MNAPVKKRRLWILKVGRLRPDRSHIMDVIVNMDRNDHSLIHERLKTVKWAIKKPLEPHLGVVLVGTMLIDAVLLQLGAPKQLRLNHSARKRS